MHYVFNNSLVGYSIVSLTIATREDTLLNDVKAVSHVSLVEDHLALPHRLGLHCTGQLPQLVLRKVVQDRHLK